MIWPLLKSGPRPRPWTRTQENMDLTLKDLEPEKSMGSEKPGL